MSDAGATFRRRLFQQRLVPILFGIGCLIGALVVLEILIRAGAISRYIMPTPLDIIGSFGRIVREEHVGQRFLLTSYEALGASVLLSVFGIAFGVLLHRVQLLRLATETWVAALASAPLVLMYPLFLVIFGRSALTIIMMGFVSALPPVVLKTLEGLSSTRPVLINVGRSFKLTPSQLYWKIMFPAALPTIFVGVRLGMIFALINIVGVEFLINFGGLGQLVNELAERYDLPGTYAAICFVILVSIIFFIATERIEKWLRPGA
jgi:NitT/TauT family transport system permease protein